MQSLHVRVLWTFRRDNIFITVILKLLKQDTELILRIFFVVQIRSNLVSAPDLACMRWTAACLFSPVHLTSVSILLCLRVRVSLASLWLARIVIPLKWTARGLAAEALSSRGWRGFFTGGFFLSATHVEQAANGTQRPEQRTVNYSFSACLRVSVFPPSLFSTHFSSSVDTTACADL